MQIQTGKVVPNADHIGIPLRLAQVVDSKVSQALALGSYLAKQTIEEWWLLPEEHGTWDKVPWEKTPCQSIQEVLARYSSCRADEPKSQKLREKICWELLTHPSPRDFFWYYFTRQVEGYGQVIAIIFGDNEAMGRFWSISGQNAPAKPLI